MIDHLVALSVAALCFIAAGCVGLQEILMSPGRPNYPQGRPRLRALMFIWSWLLMCRGAEIVWVTFTQGPPPITIFQFGSSMMLAAVHATLLENHMGWWLPAGTHARLRRLTDITTCSKRDRMIQARRSANAAVWAGAGTASEEPHPAVLTDLAQQGVRVIGPDEGPEAVVEEARRLH